MSDAKEQFDRMIRASVRQCPCPRRRAERAERVRREIDSQFTEHETSREAEKRGHR